MGFAIQEYVRQMIYIGDTKYGRHVGTDRAGNKFYENMEELPRTCLDPNPPICF